MMSKGKVFISSVYQSEKNGFFPPHSFISIVVYTIENGEQKIHYWTSIEGNMCVAEDVARKISAKNDFEIVREKIVTDGGIF